MIYLVGLLVTALLTAVVTASLCSDDKDPMTNRRLMELEQREERRREKLYGRF